MRLLSYVLPFAAFFVLAAPALAQETAEEVFREVERRQRAVESQRAELRMDLVDDQDRIRSREMILLTKVGDDDRVRSLVLFTAPADIRGTGLLSVETGAGDDQKLYLPALRRVQRVSGASRGERFAGSDFTFEDLGSRDPDDYTSRMVRTSADAFVVEATPNPGTASAYGKIVLTVDRERYVVRQAEYYDARGRLVKRLSGSNFEEVAPGVWQAGRLVMEDLENDRQTVLTFARRDTRTPLRDGLFSERQLQRGTAGL